MRIVVPSLVALVSGVTFYESIDFDADVVSANVTRMLDKATASPRRIQIARVSGVDVTGDQTLTFSQACSPLLATLSDRADMIISPEAISE